MSPRIVLVLARRKELHANIDRVKSGCNSCACLTRRHRQRCEPRIYSKTSSVLPESVFMPTLTIDGRTVTVPAGSTILDAARTLAIDVPTLCWYPKLPVVGNCRICLVHVEGAPKLVPACATAAADGMRVTTESESAVKNRQGVLSMLLE